MTSKPRVAILGAGIGAAHLECYLALPSCYDVRLICDTDLDRARRLAGSSPDTLVLQSVDEAIAHDEVDLIDICLPPFLHAEVAEKALRAGKHVVCEKPVCASLAEFDRLASLAAAAGRHLLPVFQYRYGASIQRLRHLIRADVTGLPLVASLETHWNRGVEYYRTPWRGRRKHELGGAVLGHAIHMHDLMTAILGPVRRVSARIATRVNEIETEDCAAISLEMECGGLVTHSITLGAAEELSRLRLCFADLTAENDGTTPYDPGSEPWRFIPRNEDTRPRIDQALRDFQPGPNGFTGLFTDFHRILTTGDGADAMQETGRRSIELASAIYFSARTGQDIALPLPEDHPVYAGWAA